MAHHPRPGPGSHTIRILQKWVEDIRKSLEGTGPGPGLGKTASKMVQNFECVLSKIFNSAGPPVVWTDLMGHFRLSRVSPRGPLTAVVLGRRCWVLSILTLDFNPFFSFLVFYSSIKNIVFLYVLNAFYKQLRFFFSCQEMCNCSLLFSTYSILDIYSERSKKIITNWI